MGQERKCKKLANGGVTKSYESVAHRRQPARHQGSRDSEHKFKPRRYEEDGHRDQRPIEGTAWKYGPSEDQQKKDSCLHQAAAQIVENFPAREERNRIRNTLAVFIGHSREQPAY